MNTIRKLMLFSMNIQLFATTQTTELSDLSPEMKTFYSDYLIDNAMPELVHDQFAQKHPIPKGRGKKVEFRKYTPLTKALTPLTEGVTPAGNKLKVTTLEAEVHQYGDFIEMSDVLLLTAIDNNLVQATELLGNQAGMTLDTVTREVLVGGTNVQYAEGQVTARSALTADHKLTVKAVKMAVRALKKQNAKKINGYFCSIIHPDCAFDLTEDPEWKYPHQYSDTEELYTGEIGRIAGVRFVETTEAKIFAGAGSTNRDVYATMVLGANAYGVTEIQGGGLQHIVKQLGSAGTSDPLNQRATAGWKAIKAAVRLVEQYMVRIETCSTFNDGEAN